MYRSRENDRIFDKCTKLQREQESLLIYVISVSNHIENHRVFDMDQMCIKTEENDKVLRSVSNHRVFDMCMKCIRS